VLTNKLTLCSPIRYIKQVMTGPANVDVEALKQENEFLKEKIAELEKRIAEVSTAVSLLNLGHCVWYDS
jgi:hypothetical protein